MDEQMRDHLIEACREMRKDCLTMALAAGNMGAHLGGTFSMIEVIATLYLRVMRISKDLLLDETRDRFVLSKGHGIPAIYAALHQLGVLSEQDLQTFKANRTELSAHPFANPRIGIEYSSGSLGQGLSLGVGGCLALRRKGNHTSRFFVLLGDGECDEGSVWEAAASAAHFGLNNLIALIDVNHLQYDGDTKNVLCMDSMVERWQSFGWNALEIDGHDVGACYEALTTPHEKPLVVVLNTVKGKGVSFMENQPRWHHNILTEDLYQRAWAEVERVSV